jgi:hypothetical protein
MAVPAPPPLHSLLGVWLSCSRHPIGITMGAMNGA